MNRVSALSLIATSVLLGLNVSSPLHAHESLSAEEIKLLKEMLADYELKNSSKLVINSKNKQEITAKAKVLFLKGSTSEPFNYTVMQSDGSSEDCDDGSCDVKSVDDTSGTGYEIEIGYRPENSPYFAFGKYRQLYANGKDSITLKEGQAGGLFEFTDEPQEEICHASEAPCDVYGSQSLFSDKWSVGAGINFQPTNYLTLSPSLGITKVFVKESRYAYSGAISSNASVYSNSTYDGWGPQLGFGASVVVAKNLSLNLDTSAAITYGDILSKYKNDDDATGTPRVSSSQSTWVPVLGAAVGISYDIDFSESFVLNLNGGYEIDYLLGATSIIGSGSYDQEDSGEFMGSKGDVFFGGFNLGLGMTYKF